MTDDPSNPVALEYAVPDRPHRGLFAVTALVLSLVHLIALVLTLTLGPDHWNWLNCTLYFPWYVVLHSELRIFPLHPWLFAFVLIPLNSIVYGIVLTAIAAAATRRLLR